mmetsp:Transcript_132308/g.423276  ORF Transcript_132308/g.423276 Transcript_132308/m.423276 type:complete len:228 (-) Transcript_132308:274-957(-)
MGMLQVPLPREAPSGLHWNRIPQALLDLVPQPVAALILLFPCTRGIYDARRAQDKELLVGRGVVEESLFFLRQVADFGNACGTIGCLHALSNSLHILNMVEGAALVNFVHAQSGATPEERGEALLTADALKAPSDAAAVDAAAQTVCPARDGRPLDHHFVAFVQTPGGRLVELDGTKRCPIDHGPTSPENFLSDAASVVLRQFVAAEPDLHGFAVMALARTEGDGAG